jgi:hypothetical protein
MFPYHALFVTESGFTIWREEFVAASDLEAVSATAAMFDAGTEYASFEVWNGERILYRLERVWARCRRTILPIAK